MPKASSSRQRKFEPSSDIDEEDSLQYGLHDSMDDIDSDDEDRKPLRKSRSTKERKPNVNKGKVKAAGSDDEVEAEDAEDEGNRIDVANFRDQPLDKSDANRLNGLCKDWESMRKGLSEASFQMLNDIAGSLAEVDADGKATLELDKIVRDLVDMEQEMNFHEESLSSIAQQVRLGEPVDDALERYEKGVKTGLNEFRGKTTRQKYAKSKRYADFLGVQFEVSHPDAPMPPMTTFIPKEPGDASEDEDDIEIGGVTQGFKCPLTMTIITDPMTSTVCGHSFSGPAIREYLGTGRTAKKKCPATGCKHMIGRNDLKDDKDLAKRVKAAQRRLRATQDSDEDEVIE